MWGLSPHLKGSRLQGEGRLLRVLGLGRFAIAAYVMMGMPGMDSLPRRLPSQIAECLLFLEPLQGCAAALIVSHYLAVTAKQAGRPRLARICKLSVAALAATGLSMSLWFVSALGLADLNWALAVPGVALLASTTAFAALLLAWSYLVGAGWRSPSVAEQVSGGQVAAHFLRRLAGGASALLAAAAAAILIAILWQFPILWGVRKEVYEAPLYGWYDLAAGLTVASVILASAGAARRRDPGFLRLAVMVSIGLMITALLNQGSNRASFRRGLTLLPLLMPLLLGAITTIRGPGALRSLPRRWRAPRWLGLAALAAIAVTLALAHAIAGPTFDQLYYKIEGHPLLPLRLGLALLMAIMALLAVRLLWQAVILWRPRSAKDGG